MKKILLPLLMLTALAAVFASPLELAKDGKTEYVICRANAAAPV